MSIVFKRKLYDQMLTWKKTSNGKTALLIEGARGVGKTTVVSVFAMKEYGSAVIIDFRSPLKGTIDLFEHYHHDVKLLTSSLAMLYGVELRERDTVFVFDNVQHYPKARQLIKYLVADGRFDYMETGSLISVKENVSSIQIPSEEETVQMHPMDFEEWLWANGDEVTSDFIRGCFEELKPVGDVLHKAILEKYRTYMMVGGMPQSVSAFIETKDFAQCEKAKMSIIDLYRHEMSDIPRNNGIHSLRIFDKIPALLSRDSKVFRPGMISDGSSGEDYEYSFIRLDESRIINLCREIYDPFVGGRFKCYLLDTGLLMTLASDEGISCISDVQIELINGRFSGNCGMLFENMVAQELKMNHFNLRYAEFYEKDSDKHLHEVDFIIPKGKKIVPLEVKSGVSSRHRSLDIFMERYRKRTDRAYVIHSKDLKAEGNLIYIPIYMTMFI